VLDDGAVDDVFVGGLRCLAGGGGRLFNECLEYVLLAKVSEVDVGRSREARRTMMEVFQSLTLLWS
jgi:hypothetical protein